MDLGAPELLILLIIGCLWGPPIWGLIDAASRPPEKWQRVRRSKPAWIVAMLLLGFVAAIVYLASVRPALNAGAYPTS